VKNEREAIGFLEGRKQEAGKRKKKKRGRKDEERGNFLWGEKCEKNRNLGRRTDLRGRIFCDRVTVG